MTTFPEVTTRQQVSTIRSHFHRNLSSFNMPEVSRFIRKCRGKDQTARSNRHEDKNFPAFMSAILAEKSHSPAVVSSSDTEVSTRTQRFFAVIYTSYRLCWAKVIFQNYQVKSKLHINMMRKLLILYFVLSFFFLIAGTASDHKESEMR